MWTRRERSSARCTTWPDAASSRNTTSRRIPYSGWDPENCLAWLEKAYDGRVGLLVYLNVDSIFDDLRSNPRFQALVHRLDVPVVAPGPQQRPCHPEVSEATERSTRTNAALEIDPGTTGREGRTERRRPRQWPRDATCSVPPTINPLPYGTGAPAGSLLTLDRHRNTVAGILSDARGGIVMGFRLSRRDLLERCAAAGLLLVAPPFRVAGLVPHFEEGAGPGAEAPDARQPARPFL